MFIGRLSRVALVTATLALSAACADRTVEGTAQSTNGQATNGQSDRDQSGSAGATTTTTEGFITRADVPTDTTTTRATPPRPTPTESDDIPPEVADVLADSVVDADTYAGSRPGGWYFTTPSGKFVCGIETSALTGGAPRVGCQGEIPSSAPRLPAPGAPDNLIPANTILTEGDAEGTFVNSGGVMFAPDSGAPATLPYGELLVVDGYACAVDPDIGVTCLSPAGHGFAVSSTDYGVW